MIYIATFWTVLACAVLNRVAGGGHNPWPTGQEGDWLLKRWLPGKPLYWVTLAYGGLAWCWVPWRLALAYGFAFFMFRLFEWGPYLPMGRRAWVAIRSRFDAFIRSISFGSQRLALFWRFVFTAPAIIPLGELAGLPWLAPVQPVALWLSYELGWQFHERFQETAPNGGVPAAEHNAGTLWGLLLVGMVPC